MPAFILLQGYRAAMLGNRGPAFIRRGCHRAVVIGYRRRTHGHAGGRKRERNGRLSRKVRRATCVTHSSLPRGNICLRSLLQAAPPPRPGTAPPPDDDRMKAIGRLPPAEGRAPLGGSGYEGSEEGAGGGGGNGGGRGAAGGRGGGAGCPQDDLTSFREGDREPFLMTLTVPLTWRWPESSKGPVESPSNDSTSNVSKAV